MRACLWSGAGAGGGEGCLWRGELGAVSGPHRVTTSGRNSTRSTFLGGTAVCGEVVQCAGCRALCQCLVCGQFCLVCSYCGQLCRVLPNDFLRTQTRGMLPWRSPAPFSHAPSTMSACTKATGCHTGQWNNPNLLPGCPIDCHPATTAVPTLLPNILSAQLDSAPSFTVGSHGK